LVGTTKDYSGTGADIVMESITRVRRYWKSGTCGNDNRSTKTPRNLETSGTADLLWALARCDSKHSGRPEGVRRGEE